MKEVFHCITTIRLGGAENQLLTLVREQRNLGYKISVIFLKNEPQLKKYFEEYGTVVIDLLVDKNFLHQIIILRKLLKNKKVILHAHLPRAELICALSKRGNPLVISKHNCEKFFPKSTNFVSRALAKFVFMRASLCISISYAVQNYLIKIHEIVNNSKLRVIHYGYPELKLSNTGEKIRLKEKLGLNDQFVIGSIARLVPQKNHPTLLKAFKSIEFENKNSKLLLVGDGPLKHELVDLAKKLNIDHQIIWVNQSYEIMTLFSLMHVFVLASNYEGFGLVLLESMQNNVPIIASNNSSIPEILGKNYPGLFPTGDSSALAKLLQLSLNDNFLKQLTSNYEARLQIFHPRKMALEIERGYTSII